MSNEERKKIRVPTKLMEASWGDFFQDLAIELIATDTVSSGEESLSQITDATLPDKLFLDNEKVKNLLTTYFKTGKDFDLVSSNK